MLPRPNRMTLITWAIAACARSGNWCKIVFRIGLARMERIIKDRMSTYEIDSLTPNKLINARPVIGAVREFFMSSQLSQFMDQVNPLAELEHKRRMSAPGSGRFVTRSCRVLKFVMSIPLTTVVFVRLPRRKARTSVWSGTSPVLPK